MRKWIFVLLVNSLFASLHAQMQLEELNSVKSNPGNLRFFMHTPANLPKSKRKIVVVLHGCNQDPKGIAKTSGWNELADEHQFWVLYPMQRAINNFNQCFNWFDPKEVTNGQGEVGSIHAMLEHVVDSLQIDSTEIYVYGLSAGAGMSVALMVNYPNLFKAGAVLAGTAYLTAKNPLDGLQVMINPPDKTREELASNIYGTPQKERTYLPKLVVFHSKDDHIVNIENAHQLIQQWVSVQKLDTVPSLVERNFQGSEKLTKMSYFDVHNEVKIVFYEGSRIGHCLWVDPGEGLHQGGKIGPYSSDVNFFSTYWIACDLGILQE